ncbi:tail fiber assembly protein [Enterobacter hormaechei]|nr:tail fiber assembly protein [Enterobacter hormaechei]
MAFFYSAANNGFYDSNLKEEYEKAQAWPRHAMEISERWYCHLIDGQEKGMIITVNEYGQPALIEPPPLTKEKLIDAAEAKKTKFIVRSNNCNCTFTRRSGFENCYRK